MHTKFKRFLIRAALWLFTPILLLYLALADQFLFTRNDIERDAERRLEVYKKSEWLRLDDFPLLKSAILADLDPEFLTDPGASCGIHGNIWTLFKSSFSDGPFTKKGQSCSTVFFSAASQLVPETPMGRKRQWIYGWVLREMVSQNPKEALDIIFNRLYLGEASEKKPVLGFQNAARFYFKKELKDLKLSEITGLVAISNSPGMYHPLKHPERFLKRRNHVLEEMAELKFVSKAQADLAASEPVGVVE